MGIALLQSRYLVLAEKTHVSDKLSGQTFQRFLQLDDLGIFKRVDEIRGFSAADHQVDGQLQVLVLLAVTVNNSLFNT